MLNAVGAVILGYCLTLGTGYRTTSDSNGKKQFQIQNGPCSYTFLLPEQDNCRAAAEDAETNLVQKDDPEEYEAMQRLEQLEGIMENNTQRLLMVRSFQPLKTHVSHRRVGTGRLSGVSMGNDITAKTSPSIF